jgi:UDP-N-acetylmuramoyl-L-alanyl-D-glutamate--2,6-diaminopimelate ligase
MLLKELIKGIYAGEISPEFMDFNITSICSDSRQARGGSLFVAKNGTIEDGQEFINDAFVRGAKVVVKKRSDEFYDAPSNVCILSVDDPMRFLREALIRFYDNPSGKIKTIGITGTNGKTTITYLVESVFKCAGKSCGVIGTVNHRYAAESFPAKNTTPGIVDNYDYLSSMAEKGLDYCIMEVSSHALVQKRVDGINFGVGVFTNLTGDHLDYHKCLDDYFQAKSLLFSGLSKEALALINIDDAYGQKLLSKTQAKMKTYGIKNKAYIMAKDIECGIDGSAFILTTPDGEIAITTEMVGMHNIYNILAAAGICLNENIPLSDIRDGIKKNVCIPGRMERVDCGQNFYVFIDYAHTEDALLNVLKSIRDVSRGRIILVFGCGGDRDQSKRVKMGRAACSLADFNIITNDNPRSEDPKEIVDQIIAGFDKNNYKVVLNRHDAILESFEMAKENDVVLIAGKGHEDYQIFKDKTIKFDERSIVRELLQRKIS